MLALVSIVVSIARISRVRRLCWRVTNHHRLCLQFIVSINHLASLANADPKFGDLPFVFAILIVLQIKFPCAAT
jgi:hypothetical protein